MILIGLFNQLTSNIDSLMHDILTNIVQIIIIIMSFTLSHSLSLYSSSSSSSSSSFFFFLFLCICFFFGGLKKAPKESLSSQGEKAKHLFGFVTFKRWGESWLFLPKILSFNDRVGYFWVLKVHFENYRDNIINSNRSFNQKRSLRIR